jgi:hypothetical protein
MHQFLVALMAAAAVSMPSWASRLDPETNAFMSGLYLCRVLQSDPGETRSAIEREVWAPAAGQQGGYRKESARVFFSPDQKTCHVQTTSRIDVGHLEAWLEVTGVMDGRIKRFAWNETRKRPLRNDSYRVWRWENWRAAADKGGGVMTYEVIVLPGATQSRPGESAVTATLSYRPRPK